MADEKLVCDKRQSLTVQQSTRKSFRQPKDRPKYETISIPDQSRVHRVDRRNALTTATKQTNKTKKSKHINCISEHGFTNMLCGFK